jgi:hypothetical protein
LETLSAGTANPWGKNCCKCWGNDGLCWQHKQSNLINCNQLTSGLMLLLPFCSFGNVANLARLALFWDFKFGLFARSYRNGKASDFSMFTSIGT